MNEQDLYYQYKGNMRYVNCQYKGEMGAEADG